MILRHGLLITFVLFSFTEFPSFRFLRSFSFVGYARFVRPYRSICAICYFPLIGSSLRYLRFVPSVRLIFLSCSFPVPFLCYVNYVSSFSSDCSVTSGTISWLSEEQLRYNAFIENSLLLLFIYYYLTNLFCRDCTFCSLNFNSSANLSFSSVIFSSL